MIPLVSIERIVQDEKKVAFHADDHTSFLSYREFLLYFDGLETLNTHHFVIAAHFAYGWMPKILVLHNLQENLPRAVAILNNVRRGELIGIPELTLLRETMNHSLVGPSKLLHFINPEIYAIWDGNSYKYITGRDPYSNKIPSSDYIDDPRNYVRYLENCTRLIQEPDFAPVHVSINQKIGYAVTPLRALELVMYVNGRNKSLA